MHPAGRRPGDAVTRVRTRRVVTGLAVVFMVVVGASVGLSPRSAGGVESGPAERWIVIVDTDHEVEVVSELLGEVTAASLDDDQRRIQDGVWVLDQTAGRRAVDLDGVLEARPEQRYVATVVPNDLCLSSCSGHSGQWHHTNLNSTSAWDTSVGDGSVVIAVLDSGIRDTHVDLVGRVQRVAGCGLHSALPGSKDHGTHVAGVIGAATDNGSAIAGVAWNVQLLDVRVLEGVGGFESDIVTGIQCAADIGADVINLSLEAASSSPSTPLADAIDYARSRGAVVIGAAGNSGGTAVRYPAGYDGVIGVVSTEPSNTISSFSDRGLWAEIAAPGSNIVSLSGSTNFGVNTEDGTSFSAPMVSGAVALVEARFPSFSFDQIIRRILWTSAPYSGQGIASEYGLLDLEVALTAPRRHTWQVTDQGEVIALADAPHLGDASALAVSSEAQAAALNFPIVGMAVTPSGDGYWLVASDGGIFAFGDAVFHGSTGNIVLNQPIVGMSPDPSGTGYWLVASDGGIFAFGGAPYLGSTGAIALNERIATMLAGSEGYSLIAEDGGMFNYGPPYIGSAATVPHNGMIVGAASWLEGT